MTSRPVPWDEIQNPDSNADYRVRLVAGIGNVPAFWGKDAEGHCLLIIELAGDHTLQFRTDRVSVRGIDVDLKRADKTDTQNLVLTLEKHVDRDLFFGLCQTLVASLAPVTDAAAALGIALMHIKRWKAFLAGRDARILTPNEVRGLFAELQFLRELYQQHLSHGRAVDSWLGPDRSQQDFNFENTAVEIKSLSGRERNSVRISSEDQLESLSDRLFLKIYRLSEMPESAKAVSLNDLVRSIETDLIDPDALQSFTAKLADYGYTPIAEYDTPVFIVSGTLCHLVSDGFPRLVRSELPDGLVRVSYDIELEAIAAFACEPSLIFEGQ